MSIPLEVTDNFDGTVTLTGHCVYNPTEVVSLVVPARGYQDWQAGGSLALTLPELTPSQREFLTSGIGPTAWRQLFGDDEVEEVLAKSDDEIADDDRPKRRPGRKKKPTYYQEKPLPDKKMEQNSLFENDFEPDWAEAEEDEESLEDLGIEIDEEDLAEDDNFDDEDDL